MDRVVIYWRGGVVLCRQTNHRRAEMEMSSLGYGASYLAVCVLQLAHGRTKSRD